MKRILLSLLALYILLLTGCSQENAAASSAGQAGVSSAAAQPADTSDLFTSRDLNTSYDPSTCAYITLNGDTASATSNAVQISGNTVTITDEGTYVISGSLNDGMLIVNAGKDDKTQLVFDSVSIHSETCAPVYILQAGKVVITLPEGSSSTLSNAGTFEPIDENNIDAVIFSKEDLTLNGSGSLTITSPGGHGVVSKDDLVLTGGTYAISAASHGLSGKESVRIADITAQIQAGKDGVNSEAWITLCSGQISVSCEDDGFHADEALTIAGGDVTISKSYEGLEGLSVSISGGSITVAASDDGINSAGGNDQSGFSGPQGRDAFGKSSGGDITISGGTIYIDAQGDGIDSNGALNVSGGYTCISGPTNGGNGALDYASSASITAGTLIAAGSADMAVNFGSSSTQGSMLLSFDMQQAGTEAALLDADGQTLLSFTASKAFSSLVLSCPDIVQGKTYTLQLGDTSMEITMDSLVYGSGMYTGFGGGRGFGGGMHGGGAMPEDGSAPAGRENRGGGNCGGGSRK